MKANQRVWSLSEWLLIAFGVFVAIKTIFTSYLQFESEMVTIVVKVFACLVVFAGVSILWWLRRRSKRKGQP
jgi:nitrate/nitrite transporter NarK